MANEEFQLLDRSISDIIKARTSVRTYKKEPITKEIEEKLRNFYTNIEGPFNSKVRFKLFNSNEMSHDSSIKLGTYGVIKGTSFFIAAAVEKADKNMEELGYELEKLVLYCTSLGIGTCWLGGTFKKGEFAKAIDLKENELLPIVTPIGYASESRSIVDSIFRFASGSKNRKPWDEIFYYGSFGKPLSMEEAGEYSAALEMVRLAPSASNKQPWRIIKNNADFHFYLHRTKGYGASLGYDIQKIDMGIAMCHFELTAKEAMLKGEWQFDKSLAANSTSDIEYIISWKR
ncbi:nitroreductase family protein [Clostridium magnum]|uniref:Nitroreductase family protein n=1 Tax=Clostridium magnum DSM 2767 TaxID=1121326 RepID=A0A162QW23_9CLOT|nr:nitroreductase family protein [Clostridium magnum]KZL89049.1 nitroreductase family protein [Clostridium magnum DSM 2767]SHI23022.1 Nitroreductase family protein [Clostridium magnum DSM 2767]